MRPSGARGRSDIPPPVVDRALDGTPLYAPRGELAVEVDGSAVQCHLCGGWFVHIGSTHVVHAHGMTAAEYRQLVGLNPRHPLEADDLRVRRADQTRHQIATDPRLQRAMAAGVALARMGELQRRAREEQRERPVAVERERQLAESGARLGAARAAAYRRRREQRARELGYVDLEGYYRSRYVRERMRLEDLATELGCAESAVRGDLRRLGAGTGPEAIARRALAAVDLTSWPTSNGPGGSSGSSSSPSGSRPTVSSTSGGSPRTCLSARSIHFRR